MAATQRKDRRVPTRTGVTTPAPPGASTGQRLAPDTSPWPSALASLQQDFPGHRIWQEITGERVRYIARRMHWGISPHTVVTADLVELRTLLGIHTRPLSAGGKPVGAGGPSVAGMYDHWLGGGGSFEADRHAADAVLTEFPQVAHAARANRDFVARAVAHVAAQGVTQFLDIGAGLPASPAVHEIAQRADPAARVVCLDNDSVVAAHLRARTLLAGPGLPS